MNRKLKVFALMAGILGVCLIGVAIARTFNTNSFSAAQPDDNTALIERIQNSADHPLRIKEATDAPLKILSVNVSRYPGKTIKSLPVK